MPQESENQFLYQDNLNLISTSFNDDTDIENSDTDILDVYHKDFINEENQKFARKKVNTMQFTTNKIDARSQTNCQKKRTQRKELKSKIKRNKEGIERPNQKGMKTLEYSCKNYPDCFSAWLYSLCCIPEEEYLEYKPLPHSPLTVRDKIQQNINNIQYRASTVSTVFAQIAR